MSIVVRKGEKPKPPHRGRRRKYPLDTMSVGDFFDVTVSYQAIWSSIRYFRTRCVKKTGCPKFQIDRMAGDATFRVTRIS